jgi:hypothetical protein
MNYDYVYNYTRELIGETGLYNINNPNRINQSNKQVYLASEIEAAFPAKTFLVYAGVGIDPSKVEIQFNVELTEEEETVLDTIVSNHKDNVCINWCVKKSDGTFVVNPDTEEVQIFDSEETAQQVADALTGASVIGVVIL